MVLTPFALVLVMGVPGEILVCSGSVLPVLPVLTIFFNSASKIVILHLYHLGLNFSAGSCKVHIQVRINELNITFWELIKFWL